MEGVPVPGGTIETVAVTWIEILKVGGAYGFLVASWIVFWYLMKREDARTAAAAAAREEEVEEMRKGYQAALAEKDKIIAEKDAKIDQIYTNQIADGSETNRSVTEALTNVHGTMGGLANLSERNIEALNRNEAALTRCEAKL